MRLRVYQEYHPLSRVRRFHGLVALVLVCDRSLVTSRDTQEGALAFALESRLHLDVHDLRSCRRRLHRHDRRKLQSYVFAHRHLMMATHKNFSCAQYSVA